MLEIPDWIFDDYLKPENIYLDNGALGTRINFYSRTFSIRKDLPQEDRIYHILAIVVALHPRFVSYTCGLGEKSVPHGQEIDSEIEREASDLYKNNSNLVWRVTEILERVDGRYSVGIEDAPISEIRTN